MSNPQVLLETFPDGPLSFYHIGYAYGAWRRVWCPHMQALSALEPSSWASMLYSREVIQKTTWEAGDQNVCLHLNGSAASTWCKR
jgi:hypothetical protein